MPRWPPQTYCCYQAKLATKTKSLEFVFIMKLLTKNNAIFPVPKAIQQNRRQEDFKWGKVKVSKYHPVHLTLTAWLLPCLLKEAMYIYIYIYIYTFPSPANCDLTANLYKKQFWTRMVLYYSINLVNMNKTNRTVYPIFQHDMKIALSKVISSFIWCFTITYFIQDEKRKNIPHRISYKFLPATVYPPPSSSRNWRFIINIGITGLSTKNVVILLTVTGWGVAPTSSVWSQVMFEATSLQKCFFDSQLRGGSKKMSFPYTTRQKRLQKLGCKGHNGMIQLSFGWMRRIAFPKREWTKITGFLDEQCKKGPLVVYGV